MADAGEERDAKRTADYRSGWMDGRAATIEELKKFLDTLAQREGPTGPWPLDVLTEENREKFVDVLSIPVEDLGLKGRPRNVLKAMGIRTVGELAKVSQMELYDQRSFGTGGVNEILGKLSQYGLTLRK